MEITVKNFKTKLTAELAKKSQRCEVRECDQVNPGEFESYVDELGKSFDVRIIIDENTILSHQCDCESEPSFCQHKAALLAFIAKGIKPAAKVTSNKRVDPLTQALKDADPEKLKEWILKSLKKHKDLAIVFMSEFANSAQDLSPSEVTLQTKDAVKAVINKRARAEATEVKKIVALWMEIHRPIVEQYVSQPTNKSYFDRIHALISTVVDYKYQISTNSKRIETYFQQVLDQVQAAIAVIKDEESWIQSLRYFAQEFFLEGYYGIRREYTNIFIHLFNSGSKPRRTEIIKILAQSAQSRKSVSENDANELLQTVLPMSIYNDQFLEYKDLFTPIRHAINYNISLIDAILKLGELDTAESYCIEQIKQNTNEVYNRDYILRLKKIYTQTNDEQKLMVILSKELLYNPNFEDYQRIAAVRTHDEEFKKWRNQLLANARQFADYEKKSADFCLALRYSEGNVKGLLDYIDQKADYDCIAIYAKDLLGQSGELFIKRLLQKQESYRDQMLQEDDPKKLKVSLERLYQSCIASYGSEIFGQMVKKQSSIYRSWANLFVKYASNQLNIR